MRGPSSTSSRRTSSCTGLRSSRFTLAAPGGEIASSSRSPASTTSTTRPPRRALCLALGTPLESIRAGLEGFSAAFGRFERIAQGQKTIVILLIKNPAGANEALRTLETGVPPVLVIALNDAIADGQDVSWIWDVDFEPLLPHTQRVVATGERAAELGLRLLYGGLPNDRLEVVPALAEALDRGLELTDAGGELVVLPTYTAMLALRAILTERGLVPAYWDEPR